MFEWLITMLPIIAFGMVIPIAFLYYGFNMIQETYRKRKLNKKLRKYAKDNYEFLKKGSLLDISGAKIDFSDKQKITMLFEMLEDKE